MSVKPVFFIAAIVLIIGLSAVIHPLYASATITPPIAKKGVLDLTHWDFEENGPLSINGEWRFYWKALVHPSDILSVNKPEPTGFISVPGLWNAFELNNAPLGSYGFATYHLTILLPPAINTYSVIVHDMATTYKLWVDDQAVMSNGTVGTDRRSSVPQFAPSVARFSNHTNQVSLTLQVSNYHHKKGGFWMPITVGPEKLILAESRNQLAMEMILFGFLLMMAIYQLGLFMIRRKDKSALYFSLVCLIAGFRVLIVGERVLITQFPEVSWELYQKAEYLTFFLCILFFKKYLTTVVDLFPRLTTRIAVICHVPFIILTVITPARIFSHTLIWFQIFLAILIVYAFYILIKVFFHQRDETIWIIVGMVFLVGFVLIDILGVNQLIPLLNLSPVGLFLFIFFQSFSLSIRFNKTFVSMEVLSENLIQSNNEKARYLSEARENESKYRDLVENMNEVFFILDSTMRFTYISPTVTRTYGYDPACLSGKEASEFIYSEDISPIQGFIKSTLSGQSRQFKGRVVNSEGNIRWSRFSIRPVLLPNQMTGVQGSISDITEMKQTEELIIQTEKIMSLGGLAAGMAHELNNPLSSILIGLQTVERRLSPEIKANITSANDTGVDLTKLQTYLQKRKINRYFTGMRDSVLKASDIVRNILQFSRKSDSSLSRGDLVQLVERTIELANQEYNLKEHYDFRDIHVVREFEPDIQPISFNETELQQVILNLLQNAAWEVSRFSNNQRPRIVVRISQEDDWVSIEIEDNGPGIDPESLPHVFDPFYTTKPVGEGTGLGLSVSYMIISTNHHGTMRVESEKNKGARFIIRLPLETHSINDEKEITSS